jgi:hypothetical protein
MRSVYASFLVILAYILAVSSPISVHGQKDDLEEIAISAASNVSLVFCNHLHSLHLTSTCTANPPLGHLPAAAVPWCQSPSAKELVDGTDVVWDERL